MKKLKFGRKVPVFSLLLSCFFSPLFSSISPAEAIALPKLISQFRPKFAIIAGASPDSPNNRIDPNTNPTFAGVGVMSNGCTGTAITPSHILTVVHCGSANSFIVNNSDGTQTSYSGTTTFNPGANFPFNDLAILSLDAPLPNNIPTYGLFGQSLTQGTRITMVGYGGSGNGDVGVSINADSLIKRIGQNVVDAYLDSQQDISSSYQPLYVFDFDGSNSSTNLIGGSSLGNDLESSLWSGDSGSPSFVQVNGIYYLAGVNNFVADGINPAPLFGSFGGGVDVSQYSPWIDSVITQRIPFEFSPISGLLAIAGIITYSNYRNYKNKNTINSQIK
jgi:Trypsin